MKNAVIYETGKPKQGEMDIINSMTRRPFAEEELYVFSVTLCDNDIDRDFERFTPNALEELAKMYVGKTGIFDHSMKGKDQVARVFSCQVQQVEGTFTRDGLPYYRLTARAYMPRTPKNDELITDIDAGINKEVSVGCSMQSAVCSVCGTDRRIGCSHKNGRHYKKDGKKVLCHTILDNPGDAFEWSFVAVPAQPKAGVTKSYSRPNAEDENRDIVKAAAQLLGIGESDDIDSAVSHIKALAAKGQEYLQDIKSKAMGDLSIVCGDLSTDAIKSVLDSMEMADLEAFCKNIHSKALEIGLPRPQTACQAKQAASEDNHNFIV